MGYFFVLNYVSLLCSVCVCIVIGLGSCHVVDHRSKVLTITVKNENEVHLKSEEDAQERTLNKTKHLNKRDIRITVDSESYHLASSSEAKNRMKYNHNVKLIRQHTQRRSVSEDEEPEDRVSVKDLSFILPNIQHVHMDSVADASDGSSDLVSRSKLHVMRKKALLKNLQKLTHSSNKTAVNDMAKVGKVIVKFNENQKNMTEFSIADGFQSSKQQSDLINMYDSADVANVGSKKDKLTEANIEEYMNAVKSSSHIDNEEENNNKVGVDRERETNQAEGFVNNTKNSSANSSLVIDQQKVTSKFTNNSKAASKSNGDLTLSGATSKGNLLSLRKDSKETQLDITKSNNLDKKVGNSSSGGSKTDNNYTAHSSDVNVSSENVSEFDKHITNKTNSNANLDSKKLIDLPSKFLVNNNVDKHVRPKTVNANMTRTLSTVGRNRTIGDTKMKISNLTESGNQKTTAELPTSDSNVTRLARKDGSQSNEVSSDHKIKSPEKENTKKEHYKLLLQKAKSQSRHIQPFDILYDKTKFDKRLTEEAW